MAAPGTDAHRGDGRVIQLLEADPDLAAAMPAADVEAATRFAVAPIVRIERGAWSAELLAELAQPTGAVHGFQIVSGLGVSTLALADRTCTRLLGPRDLVLFDGLGEDSLPTRSGWQTLEPTALAVLDDRVIACCQRWPSLLSAIFRRSAVQTRQAFLQQAIGQLPRVEDRLLAMLWTLADRRGIARRDGMFIEVSLSHRTLAQMIGARRPTVSLGLKRLADRGDIRVVDGGWVINRRSLEGFLSQAVSPPGADRAR